MIKMEVCLDYCDEVFKLRKRLIPLKYGIQGNNDSRDIANELAMI